MHVFKLGKIQWDVVLSSIHQIFSLFRVFTEHISETASETRLISLKASYNDANIQIRFLLPGFIPCV